MAVSCWNGRKMNQPTNLNHSSSVVKDFNKLSMQYNKS